MSAGQDSDITIEFPCDGAVLNKHHGVETAQGLKINLRGRAKSSTGIGVNGLNVFCADGSFDVGMELKEKFNEITLSSAFSKKTITVVWDRNSFRRYHFFIDDNIFFLTEIFRKSYKSIFESFYLARLKKIHAQYGTKFVLNTFFRNDHEPFELSQFPGCYRKEWEDNADWLKLSFHAFSEFPGAPYRECSEERPCKLPLHYAQLREQVVRFAGENTFCPPSIIHFCDVASPLSLKYLKDNGTIALGRKSLPGSAEKNQTDITYDAGKGLFHMPVDLICNLCSMEQIRDVLEGCMAKSWKDTLNLGTHEQYCYPHYKNYMPDHFERIESAIRLLTENGFSPVFFHEGLLGNTK
ncbi:MAG: hypothetical protein A2X49_11605 [Lentisphaerae bacterium GWF2_52_8]|nr:MAG: hypothetical protein A2X49_11605 [Lentisphaerae bacterium GWF2_52_8]